MDKKLKPLSGWQVHLYTSLKSVKTKSIDRSSQMTTILPSYWIKFNSLVHLREKAIADQIIQN